MNKKLVSLADRRQQLIIRAEAQRVAFAENFDPLRTPLALADKALTVIHYVKQHPVLMVGAGALFSLLRPTRAGKWLQSSWLVLQIARNVRGWLREK